MDFDLTEDQKEIKTVARDLLTARSPFEAVRSAATAGEYDPALWNEIRELGWPGIAVGEAHGGQGLGIVELSVLLEELGYACAATPFLPTATVAAAIEAAGSDAQRERWLPALAAGEARGAVATVLHDVGWTAVPDADGADVIVVRENDAWSLAAQTSAEAVEPLDSTRRLWRVRAEGDLEPLPGEGERAFDVVAVALAAESVGVARRAMEMAVEYAKEREQFGRPIGAYQAISHACAQMLLEVEGARSTTLYAAWALDHEPESGPLGASMAKAYASDAGWRVPASALQVHGGIGFTWEHDLHLWLKRGKANAYLWGDSRAHRDRVAGLIGL
jgi:alkylation response protein AidB-like acyl-CoA dehydrogenase